MTPELMTELRSKKNQLINQIETAKVDENMTRKSISELMNKHSNVEERLMSHVEKQTSSQEDQFNQKMRERKNRSISRSLNRTSDAPKEGKPIPGSTENMLEGKRAPGKGFKMYQNNLKFGG